MQAKWILSAGIEQSGAELGLAIKIPGGSLSPIGDEEPSFSS